jgi:hypothetical protein
MIDHNALESVDNPADSTCCPRPDMNASVGYTWPVHAHTANPRTACLGREQDNDMQQQCISAYAPEILEWGRNDARRGNM